MSPPPSEQNPAKTSLLVADQPGMLVAWGGLALALLLGFLVRGLINEDAVKARVMELLKHQTPQEQVKVDRAWVRLSQGVFPDFSLVLSRVHIESQNACALSPSADLHEIRFPISLWGLVRGKIQFDKAEIDQAVVLLRSDLKECSHERTPSSTPEAAAQAEASPTTPPTVSAATAEPVSPAPHKSAALTSTEAEVLPLSRIEVQSLRVNYLPIPFTTFEFQDFDLEVDSLKPLVFSVHSNLDLAGETLSGDYSSHAVWKLSFDEREAKQGKFNFTGSWREGRYDLKAEFEGVRSKKYDLSLDLQHIPLSQVFPVLKKYKVMVADFNGKQTWITAQVSSHGTWDHMTHGNWDIEDVKLEGDLGEIGTSKVHFQKLEPLAFDPIDFQIKALDFDALMVFLGRPHPSPALGHLGRFDGHLNYQGAHSLDIEGVHSGLELVFSNKGSRQLQGFKSFKVALQLKDSVWMGKMTDFEIPEGELLGQVKVNADKDLKDLDLNAELQNLKFSPAIEKLMTQGGYFKSMSGKLSAHFQKGSLQRLDGSLQGLEWKIEGLRALSPQMSLGQNKNKFSLKMKSESLSLPSDSAASDLLKSFHKENPQLFSESLELKNVSVEVQTNSLNDFQWNHLEAQSEKFRVQSSGGWAEDSHLFGEVKVLEKIADKKAERRKTHRWKLQGTRSQPQFLKD